ncbi:MAG TPA: hypothetical protein VGW74_08080 [Propionibacteriaceae bacterium]|nr:hypothetical protein [Propionibacteriaceae bacterium]
MSVFVSPEALRLAQVPPLACPTSYTPTEGDRPAVIGCGACGRTDVVATPGRSGALVVEPHRPSRREAELAQRAELAILTLAIDPSYVDGDYGLHGIECWQSAFSEPGCFTCTCSGTPTSESLPSPLAALLDATGGA